VQLHDRLAVDPDEMFHPGRPVAVATGTPAANRTAMTAATPATMSVRMRTRM
jgi:hypothetical protein